MGNVAKYQHGWNMTFTVVELLMIIPKSTYLSISLPYFSIYHFFSLTLLCKEAQKKSEQMGLDISFAISDANGLPRLYRRFGEALVLSITLVPNKAYTSAITQLTTEDLADLVVEDAALQGINTADPRITVVTGGFPLFYKGKIIGAIGIGGGTEAQDREIGEYVLKIFEKHISNK